MIRRPPRSTLSSSSAASDVYKRQSTQSTGEQHRSMGICGPADGDPEMIDKQKDERDPPILIRFKAAAGEWRRPIAIRPHEPSGEWIRTKLLPAMPEEYQRANPEDVVLEFGGVKFTLEDTLTDRAVEKDALIVVSVPAIGAYV
eukprot:TRINITY_DN1571_c0_g1_i2.p3 TRINITY_DN1571_c0_g1~~TRINITY_DN1571_c0_g1_i2.p3  ORF type:complete len:144 (-),score=35.75 TRINITY_DN1571_c0_g1_i2:332-763(-)